MGGGTIPKRDYTFDFKVYKYLLQGGTAETLARALSKGDFNEYNKYKVKISRTIKRLVKEGALTQLITKEKGKVKFYRPGKYHLAFEEEARVHDVDVDSIRGVLSDFIAYVTPSNPFHPPPEATDDPRLTGELPKDYRTSLHHIEFSVKRLMPITPVKHPKPDSAFPVKEWRTRGGTLHREFKVFINNLQDWASFKVTYNKDSTISLQIRIPAVEIRTSQLQTEQGIISLKYFFWQVAYNIVRQSFDKYYHIPDPDDIPLYLVKKPHYEVMKIPILQDLDIDRGHIPVGEKIWIDFSDGPQNPHIETDDPSKFEDAKKIGDFLLNLNNIINQRVKDHIFKEVNPLKIEVSSMKQKVNYVYNIIKEAEEATRKQYEHMGGMFQ